YTEGDEVRTGQPVVQVVNPAAMRVRARVNQADINDIRVGQPVAVGLDAYPELSFTGSVTQISPIGAQSTLNPKVRTYTVLVVVKGAHPHLIRERTAALEVELERTPHALVIPGDAVVVDAEQSYVVAQRGVDDHGVARDHERRRGRRRRAAPSRSSARRRRPQR